MAQLTKEQANRKIRNKEMYYEVDRNGGRTTTYYFSDLKSALEKYDAICRGNRKTVISVTLSRWNNPEFANRYKHACELLYSTTRNISARYRDVGADRY